MKKLLAVVLSVLVLFGSMSLTAFAAETAKAEVYVTIADGEGKLALTQEKITVTDTDNDGALTINDALYAAHEAKYAGGAAAGYSSYLHADYGLSLGKLWGNDSGSYGYYVNDASAWSLADAVEEGDYIYAFVYTQMDWSDAYCWFDAATVTADVGDAITLTLSTVVGYDPDNFYAPVAGAVKGATITVNGEEIDAQTDDEGKVTITMDAAGEYVISATADDMVLVPPVCKVTVLGTVATTTATTTTTTLATTTAATTSTTVKTTARGEASPATGDTVSGYALCMLAAVSLAGIALSVMRRKSYEK